MRKVELLAPAGTLKSMRYAFAYGADAVYAGQPRYSLRVRNNDFLEDNLDIGIFCLKTVEQVAHDLALDAVIVPGHPELGLGSG